MGSHKPEVITKQRSGIRTEVVWNQNTSGLGPEQKWYGTRREVVWNQDKHVGTRTEEEEVA